MKKYLIMASVAFMLSGYASIAQDKKEDSKDRNRKLQKTEKDGDDDKLKEYDEIIIKRKDADKDAKITVEIKDDQVFVDGKPIEEFEDDEVSVRKRSMKRFRLHSPDSPFRFEGGNWEPEFHMNPGEDRAFLGVMTEGSSNGAKIQQVTENSAAEKAGLKTGDVITKVNDKAVFDPEQLSEAIASFKPDDKVTITYKRDGKENKTTVTLGKRRSAMTIPGHPNMPNPPMVFNFDDHNFDNFLDLRNRPRLGIKAQDTEDGKGVKVIEVEDGSAAEKAGIKENDLITSFEGKEVNSASELVKASREARDKSSLKVDISRNGKPQSIEVKVPKKLKTANL